MYQFFNCFLFRLYNRRTYLQYSSAIQAEVTQLYAMLEQDHHHQDLSSAIRMAPITWDLPRYFNKLISRSCVSLSDSNQVNMAASAAICNNGKCSSAAIGWGSTSCLQQCKTWSSHGKRVNGKSCRDAFKVHQSSLVTVLNLAVDSSGNDTIYQLLDPSLLLFDNDVTNAGRTVQLVQQPIAKSNRHRMDSDDGSTSQELIMSFQW